MTQSFSTLLDAQDSLVKARNLCNLLSMAFRRHVDQDAESACAGIEVVLECLDAAMAGVQLFKEEVIAARQTTTSDGA